MLFRSKLVRGVFIVLQEIWIYPNKETKFITMYMSLCRVRQLWAGGVGREIYAHKDGAGTGHLGLSVMSMSWVVANSSVFQKMQYSTQPHI